MKVILQNPEMIRSVFTSIVFAFLFSATSLAATSPDENEVAMYRGNPQHTGVFNTKGVAALGGVKWRFKAAGPVRSSPAIAQGIIYFGSADRNLYAVDSATGQMKWKFQAGGAVQSSPAVWRGMVYFGSADGSFYALDAKTGQMKWSHKSANSHYEGGWDYVSSSPAVANGTVYFGSGDYNLYALDARTGKERWKFRTEGMVRSSPAVHEGVIYVGSHDGNLYAIDLSGQLKWKFKTEGNRFFPKGEIQSSPAVAEGIVAFGSRDGRLYAVDIQTGKEIWRFDHNVSWVITSPVIHNGVVYAGSSDGRFVQAVEAKTGKEKWRFKTGRNVLGSPAYADGIFYFGDLDRKVYALDAETGKEKWRFTSGGDVHSSVLISDGAVYFGSDDGYLYALKGRQSDETLPAAIKTVFWDNSIVFKWFQGHERVRDYFAAQGYEVLNITQLSGFLRTRIADKSPSVVVFAVDSVPTVVANESQGKSVFMQYLEAGGKVVWIGIPPFGVKKDPETGQAVEIDQERALKAFGLEPGPMATGEYNVVATAEGKRWGLPDWWIGEWAVETRVGITVLGTNEYGKAAAWAKNYGGPEGTGFVRVWGRNIPIDDLSWVKAVAEYGLR